MFEIQGEDTIAHGHRGAVTNWLIVVGWVVACVVGACVLLHVLAERGQLY